MTDSARFEVLASGYGLIEGPTVGPDGGLYFSDVLGGGVFHLAARGAVTTVVPKRRGVGGIAAHADGGIVCSGRDIVHVKDGVPRTLFAIDGHMLLQPRDWQEFAQDVLEPYALGRHDGGQRPDLVDDQVLDVTRRAAHLAPAEAHQVLEARVRADRHAVTARELHGATHHAGVTGVEPTRDVVRRDDRHQGRVIAERPGAERLAKVRIEINSIFFLTD